MRNAEERIVSAMPAVVRASTMRQRARTPQNETYDRNKYNDPMTLATLFGDGDLARQCNRRGHRRHGSHRQERARRKFSRERDAVGCSPIRPLASDEASEHGSHWRALVGEVRTEDGRDPGAIAGILAERRYVAARRKARLCPGQSTCGAAPVVNGPRAPSSRPPTANNRRSILGHAVAPGHSAPRVRAHPPRAVRA
jgi:hypothetical protein